MDVMTVKDVKKLQSKISAYNIAANSFIVDHGVVEVPEEKFSEIQRLLKDFYEILDLSIDNAEVFRW